MRQSYWEIRALGVDVVVAANDTPETNRSLRERYDLPFSVLSDDGAKVAKLYGTYHEQEPRERDISLVSFFLIDRAENGGKILWEYIAPSSRYRMAPSRVLEELQQSLGRERKIVSVVVPSQWQVERLIAAFQEPPLGVYTTPEEVPERIVLTYRDYTRELAMQAHAEVHRFAEAGWTLTAVTPEHQGNVVIGQRYVFMR